MTLQWGRLAITMKNLNPCLKVADIKKSIAFYEDVLDFKVTMTIPEEGTPEWAALQQDNITLMLHSVTSKINEISVLNGRPPGGALSFYVLVEDAATMLNKIKGKAPVVWDLHDTFYGTKEFAIQDPDGFVWVLCQNVSCDCPGAEQSERAGVSSR